MNQGLLFLHINHPTIISGLFQAFWLLFLIFNLKRLFDITFLIFTTDFSLHLLAMGFPYNFHQFLIVVSTLSKTQTFTMITDHISFLLFSVAAIVIAISKRLAPLPLTIVHVSIQIRTRVDYSLKLDHLIYNPSAMNTEQNYQDGIISQFMDHLQSNRVKAQQKKEEYLQKIMQIFKEFVRKCQGEIDKIIEKKLTKLQDNYTSLLEYLQKQEQLTSEEKKLVVTQFLIKPFEKFPFSGNKNEKVFQEQYNLIEKASILIEQTLVDSFNEEEIPNFDNEKFFDTLQKKGVGEQSLVRLSISPQNLSLQSRDDLVPLQKNIRSLKMMDQYLILIGDERFIEIWDLQERICLKKLYMSVMAPITTLAIIYINDLQCLAVGFGEASPEIWVYRTDNWKVHGCNLTHTRSVTKLLQVRQWLLSGSLDGNVCIYSMNPFNHMHSCPHISSIQDLIHKNNYVYVLLKCSSICEYELQELERDVIFQFRRTLSSGYISMIRFTEVGGNFTGVSCHIYGLSQIEITKKFRVSQSNIINVSEMISDFVILESKESSEYFAVCAFQNSSAIRIYSLKSGEAIYQVSTDYLGEAGVAGYLPKIELALVGEEYWIMLVNQSEFETGNTIRVYLLRL